jgi:ABC-type transport system substrate-binding protein
MLLVVFFCGSATASTTPRYGGTLTVELRESALNLDPAKWRPGAPENAASLQVAAAIFDRLLTLDRFGRFQPALATDWSHDASSRRWQFVLRPGVQFSDGSPLTASDVAGALEELLVGTVAVKAEGSRVVVQLAASTPDLLEQLASGRNFIYRRTAEGPLLGTGPFLLSDLPAAPATGVARYRLAASEHCWAGRPFLDEIQVNLGVPPLRQLFDLQLGKADIVEISPDLVRRAVQENLRLWASDPVLLYALQVGAEPGPAQRSAPGRPHLGEALSQAVDRATMANVLLQKQAEPAASFLPQWLSGYAFVFALEKEDPRPRESGVDSAAKSSAAEARSAPAGVAQDGVAPPLRLRVDAGGDLAKLIAERVAINARQAGITVQVVQTSPQARAANSARSADTAGLRLVAWRYSSLSQRAELDAMTAAWQLEPASDEKGPADAEALYAREDRLLAARTLIPLVVMSEHVGIGSAVRDWMPERWGEWHLADVWLEEPHPVAAGAPR